MRRMLKIHKDNTVTYWSVYNQVWVRNVDPREIPDIELAAMSPTNREKTLGLLWFMKQRDRKK